MFVGIRDSEEEGLVVFDIASNEDSLTGKAPIVNRRSRLEDLSHSTKRHIIAISQAPSRVPPHAIPAHHFRLCFPFYGTSYIRSSPSISLQSSTASISCLGYWTLTSAFCWKHNCVSLPSSPSALRFEAAVSSFLRRRLREMQNEDKPMVTRRTETKIAMTRPMISFLVSVIPAEGLCVGCVDDRTFAVAVAVAVAVGSQNSPEITESVFDNCDRKQLTVDGNTIRSEASNGA